MRISRGPVDIEPRKRFSIYCCQQGFVVSNSRSERNAANGCKGRECPAMTSRALAARLLQQSIQRDQVEESAKYHPPGRRAQHYSRHYPLHPT